MNFAQMLMTPVADAPVRRHMAAEEREKAGRKSEISKEIIDEMRSAMFGNRMTAYEIVAAIGSNHRLVHRRLLRLESFGFVKRDGKKKSPHGTKPQDVWVWEGE